MPTVRPLQAGDRPALKRLLAAAGVFSPTEVAVASEVVDLSDEEAAASGYRFAVAGEGTATVGYVCHGPAWFSDTTWDLYWLAVSPTRRRRGIGRGLLSFVEQAARAEGARTMLVETAAQEAYAPARRLYTSHGYVEVARLAGFYAGGHDKVIYRKALDGRGAAQGGGAPAVRVGESPGRGRGVFATRDLAAGETIERAPVIVLPPWDWPPVERTTLRTYCYKWGVDDEAAAVGLGCASLYNHSFTPNARFVTRLAEEELEFVALCAIGVGEEIIVNYNREPGDRTPVWFEPV